METQRPAPIAAAALAAWFAYLAADLWINAVVFASYWRATAEYWRPARELFRLIPVGYLSFAIYCGLLAWLLSRLYPVEVGVRAGIRFGAILGLLTGASGALGLFSAIRTPVSMLLYWPLWATLESALAGAVAAWVLSSQQPWRRTLWAFLWSLLATVLAFAAQSLFFPPPPGALTE